MASKTTKNKVSTATHPVLSARALGRATLERQLLLRRTSMPAKDAVAHLVGLQAQNVKPPYVQLAARLDGFAPEELAGLMAAREVGRMVTLRSTIHTHTADDCLALRPLIQPVLDRGVRAFRKGLVGVDLAHLAAYSRELVEERPRSLKELRQALTGTWPDADPAALTIAARCLLPLVQITPRGLWERSGQVTLTTAEAWFGRETEPRTAPEAVARYLEAFGPASVKDMQVWCGLTRLNTAFDQLRPELLMFQDENGVELFDLHDAPRPDVDTPAPPRFLPEYDNLLLSHADRTRVMPTGYRERTWGVNQGYPTFLVDGLVAGIWKLMDDPKDKERTTLTIHAFGTLTREQEKEVAEEAERMIAVLFPAASASYDIRFADFTVN